MFGGPRDGDVRLLDFAPVLVANALPFVGVAFTETGETHITVFALYWFEMLSLFLVYCGCALFAQRSPATDEETDESVFDRLPSVRVHRSMPTVHLRNLRIVVPVALLLGAFVVGLGDWVISSHEDYGAFPAWLSTFTRPGMLLPALGIVAAHLLYAARNYFGPGRHRTQTPQTVLDVPIRLLMVYMFAIIVWFFTFAFGVWFALEAFSRSTAELVAAAVLLGGFFVLKLGIEWARFRAEHAADPSGLAAWLVPDGMDDASSD